MAARIADLSMRSGDRVGAAVWYAQAIEAGGGDTALLLRAAEAEFASGAFDSARATAVRVLERDPANRAAQALLRRIR